MPTPRHPVARVLLRSRMPSRPRLRSLALVVACASACFDDRGLSATTTESTSTGATTTTTTTTTTATTTGGPTGSSTTSTDPTGEPTTTELEDPTVGEPGPSCQEACKSSADCTVMGADLGVMCQSNRCIHPDSLCQADVDCVAGASGWVTPCNSQADCTSQVCIDIGGAGRCATQPTEFVTCETIGQTEIKQPPIEGGAELIVCANTEFVCEQGACTNPCEDEAACAATPGHPTCEAGACVCTSDEDCLKSGLKGATACVEGLCGCTGDADCAERPNADVCGADGRCGCSSAAVCTEKKFDGTTLVCEGA